LFASAKDTRSDEGTGCAPECFADGNQLPPDEKWAYRNTNYLLLGIKDTDIITNRSSGYELQIAHAVAGLVNAPPSAKEQLPCAGKGYSLENRF
jgi:hypothetical protein